MTFLRQTLAAVRLLLVMTVLLGIAYPLAITGVAQVVAPVQANGSRLTGSAGQVVGSALIGQAFEGPEWFQGRPSASDYSGETSGGSNLSPKSADQADARAQREADLKAANPAAVGPVPEDALTASASGLDPHISLAYALWQVPRVAQSRGVDADRLIALITVANEPAALGFLGQDGVNVTRLNLALARE
ncbi:MAG TPA: potassium-transporting ATPase subunit KdpC [Propionicimonas sp.]|nr:potassium-transporting ATPase subunit KdpC [Propionicimonas sp.]